MPRFLTMVLLTLWTPCFWRETILVTLSKALTAVHKVTFMCPVKTYMENSICVIAQCTYTDKNAGGRLTLCCMLRTSTYHMHGVLNHNITFIQVLTCILQFLWQLWRTWMAIQHWNIGSNSLGTRLASASHVRHSSAIAIVYISPASSSAEPRAIVNAVSSVIWIQL